MRSIKARFNKFQKKQPLLGSYIILAQAVREQRLTQSAITREFTKLVPKEEYVKSERRNLIKHLVEISNTLLRTTS